MVLDSRIKKGVHTAIMQGRSVMARGSTLVSGSDWVCAVFAKQVDTKTLFFLFNIKNMFYLAWLHRSLIAARGV